MGSTRVLEPEFSLFDFEKKYDVHLESTFWNPEYILIDTKFKKAIMLYDGENDHNVMRLFTITKEFKGKIVKKGEFHQSLCYNHLTTATMVVEPGQGRKAAAIRLLHCVRWLFL